MWTKAAPLIVLLSASSCWAQTTSGQPLSAIDWLSDSVTPPPSLPPVTGLSPLETLDPSNGIGLAIGPLTPDVVLPMTPPATSEFGTGGPDPISVQPLGAPRLDAVGLLSPAITGLPRDLWGNSDTADLVHLLGQERVESLPALQTLLYTLLLAELAPPVSSDANGTLLQARLDKLLEMGALEQAQALVERAGPTATPELFRRWFDISLLTGHEDRACLAMRATPDIAPTFPARIFCLARGGDWNAAALTLETGRALGYVSDDMDALLLRFLEPDFADPNDPLEQPLRPSPLVFRMLEAIGEPMPTGLLPLAFAQTDLSATSGWKPRIEAAERLARAGAISPNRLLGIYTERRPAASGGIWDRVAALQAFDVAILTGGPQAVEQTLPAAWSAMKSARLEVPFAQLYAQRLSKLPLTGDARPLAFRIGLLSDSFERIALDYRASTDEDLFLQGIARGLPDPDHKGTELQNAITAALTAPALGPTMQARVDDGRLGEALLHAITLVADGAKGDVADVAEGLSLLRIAGLESVARRAALQMLILRRQ